MKKLIGYICLLTVFGCYNSSMTEEELKNSKYPRMIGDIKTDDSKDDKTFKLCNDEKNLVQYYAISKRLGEKTYQGEKYAIEKVFNESYKTPINNVQSGLIRIRFIINCNGQSGRFRLLSMDNDYNEMVFDKTISDQLLKITKSLDGWKKIEIRDREIEYYQYLIFKIDKGEIIEILP